MALSFEESKKLLSQQVEGVAKSAEVAVPAAMPMFGDDGMMALESGDIFGEIAAYSEWTRSDKYDWYDEYTDDKVSSVDKNKNITIDASQINISQEENSQFIPFEMPRYYDGYDLMNADIEFCYVSSDGYKGSSRAVNVSYDTATIKFAWLIDGDVTHIAGNLKFEIHAYGVNSKGNAYVWKTKSFDKMTVLQSLIDDNKDIVLDDSWVQELVERVAINVTEQIAGAQVAGQVEAAERAAARAETAANNAQNTVNNSLKNYYTKSEVDSALDSVEVDLTGYATETYVQEQIEAIPEVDLSGYALKSEIPSIEGLATETYVQEEIAKVDVSDQLVDYALKSELPSIEGLATETYVDEAVAAVDVSDQLEEYAKSADVYTKSEVDEALKNVEVDLSNYYTKTEVDTTTGALSSSINTNTSSITSLNKTVEEINQTLEGIDKSPRVTYDATYGDVELDDGSTA